MKKTLSLLLAVSSMTLNAQTIPSLPGKIEPGANDKLYFVCDVSAINDDDHAFRAYGQKKNLWTQAVKGGKYELVNPLLVRVMAPDLDSARKDIYSFYIQI